MKSFLTHLESPLDGTRLPADRVQTLHNGRPLLARYDLAAVRDAVTRGEVERRPPSMWRYRELLPLPLGEEPVTFGEGFSPLLRCPRLGEALGLKKLWVKDESQLPTGSFKSRGMAAAVSMARHFGLTRVALPTNGNAGGAAAAYAARAGMEAFVFMPADTPAVNRREAVLYGATAYLIDGLINDCGKLVRDGVEAMAWFDLSTLKEPYRLEGKKTMGLEIAEQLGWRLPGAILYPTGGGTGLIGMHKAFGELRELGWVGANENARLYACQSEGCAPIVRAFEAGAEFAEPFEGAHTAASGIRVPAAVGDFLMLRAVRESGGSAVRGSEDAVHAWTHRACMLEGISICPEAAVCLECLGRLVEDGAIDPDEDVVVFNTGAAQKYLEVLPPDPPRLDINQSLELMWRDLASRRA